MAVKLTFSSTKKRNMLNNTISACQGFIKSQIDYCSSDISGPPVSAIRSFERIQNAAARLVFNLWKFSHFPPVLSSLHGLPVTVRIKPKSLFLACNSPQNHYLKSFIKLVHSSLVAAISHFWWLKSPQSEDFLLIQVQNFLSGSSLEQTPNIKYHNS